ncbi:MFS transporter [Bordetella sp. 15P40C-2]|uniref:MFS transporter n=1 Tax=Bordetella sp. 15P40C-2 TaxID=2572246 RepID=UPI00132B57D6|nr:MFS transporter [Bordetella sp. 15P40C-2]MVW73632.1 MFS transporter [Bordetella sp. 15P40C-2]
MKLRLSPVLWLSFAMIVGVMGTALISPLYALYKETWQLQTSDISLIYVVYMAGAMCGLLFLGRLSDRVGFRPMMTLGLILTLIGTAISLFAWDLGSLCVGRVIVGVASSMVTTSANAGMTRLAPPGQTQRAAVMSSFLLALGFGLGPFVGGIMGQWAPSPLVTTYIPTLILGAIAVVALIRLRLPAAAQTQQRMPLRLRDVLPKLTLPEAADVKAFILTTCLPFLAFGVFGLYASMSPLFLNELVPWHGPVVSGTAIASILLASATTQILSRRIRTDICGCLGLTSLVVSNALLMVNLWTSSSVLFGLGVLFTAIGHGWCMLAGMSMINRIATSENRAGLLSTYLVIGYIGSMIPMIGVGWIADHWGMNVAVSTFCTFVVVTGLATAVLFKSHPRMQPLG